MQRVNWLDGVSLLIGIWLIGAPWYLNMAGAGEGGVAARWTFGLVGITVIYLSLGILFAFSRWEEWANVALGAWLLASPWLLSFQGLAAAVWTALVAGAVLVAIGIRRGLNSGGEG